MFHYWQGYELDGSDTSYNLVTPEREKCLEIARYYLGLKTIHKEAPLKLRIRSKIKSYGEQTSEREVVLKRHELDQLDTLLSDPMVVSCDIFYRYVHPNNQYPEVKREIVEIMDAMSAQNGKRLPLHNPVFWNDGELVDCISLYLTPERAQRVYGHTGGHTGGHIGGRTGDMPDKGYSLHVREAGAFYTVEIGLSLNGDYGNSAYNIKRLSERFPELGIDVDAVWRDMKGPKFYLSGKTLYERIELEGTIETVLERLLRRPEFGFSLAWWKLEGIKRDTLRVEHVPQGLDAWEPHFYEEYDAKGNPVTNPRLEGMNDPRLKILKGITGGKCIMTPSEYAVYIGKLAETAYFSDMEFTRLSTVWVKLGDPLPDTSDAPMYDVLGFLHCFRRKGGVAVALDVPRGLYDFVRRAYGL